MRVPLLGNKGSSGEEMHFLVAQLHRKVNTYSQDAKLATGATLHSGRMSPCVGVRIAKMHVLFINPQFKVRASILQ